MTSGVTHLVKVGRYRYLRLSEGVCVCDDTSERRVTDPVSCQRDGKLGIDDYGEVLIYFSVSEIRIEDGSEGDGGTDDCTEVSGYFRHAFETMDDDPPVGSTPVEVLRSAVESNLHQVRKYDDWSHFPVTLVGGLRS